jgi:D-3-phosphoglycerate dehydrogenase
MLPSARLRLARLAPSGAARCITSKADEIKLLERLLEAAKNRPEPGAADDEADSSASYDGPAFKIKTFNAISPVGLAQFPNGKYDVSGDLEDDHHAIMLRSHKLQISDVSPNCRAIARCGAGVNNIPVKEMTELGIPVFNTPGANANAVKELMLCGLLLASRGIAEGIKHVDTIYDEESDHGAISKRIEADKKMFRGQEIKGKTLGVVGMGAIGARGVEAALALGMDVVGYDPVMSMEAAFALPGKDMKIVESIEQVVAEADYVTLHVPYMESTHGLMSYDLLRSMKPGACLLNFSRGELVDTSALKSLVDRGDWAGKYVSDFPDQHLYGSPHFLCIPHLGASTEEAEETSAAMAADQIMDYLETGTVRNSVNFPNINLAPADYHEIGARLCIVNAHTPGILGEITTFIGDAGINIVQQYNASRGDMAYTVVDIATVDQGGALKDAEALQDGLSNIPGVISSRFIGDPFKGGAGTPGTNYKNPKLERTLSTK